MIGCAPSPKVSVTNSTQQRSLNSIPLFSPKTVLQDRWQHMKFRGETEYRLAFHSGRLSIRAVGKKSASGLIRRVNIDPVRCPKIEWEWRVDAIQIDADLQQKAKEDVAASILLLFGDPGFLSAPEPVPTLRYVWTNDRVAKETIVDNPYMPGIVRSIVVRSGRAEMRNWITERRNLVSDFEKAFGRPLKQSIHAVAIFTDNDQTEQNVVAHYGSAKMICKSPSTTHRN